MVTPQGEAAVAVADSRMRGHCSDSDVADSLRPFRIPTLKPELSESVELKPQLLKQHGVLIWSVDGPDETS